MSRLTVSRRDQHDASRPGSGLASLLGEVRAGKRLLRCCAWCGRVELDGEWVHPDSPAQTRLLRHRVTHGICTDCFEALTRDRPKARAAAGRH